MKGAAKPLKVGATNPVNKFDDDTERVDNDMYPDELDEGANSLEDDEYPDDDEYEEIDDEEGL